MDNESSRFQHLGQFSGERTYVVTQDQHVKSYLCVQGCDSFVGEGGGGGGGGGRRDLHRTPHQEQNSISVLGQILCRRPRIVELKPVLTSSEMFT